MDNCISQFIEKFKQGGNLQKTDEEILKFGKQMLPKEIIELWEEYGFGEYGDGLIKVVAPREYMNSLYTWLGQKDFLPARNSTVFAMRHNNPTGYMHLSAKRKSLVSGPTPVLQILVSNRVLLLLVS